MSYFSFFRLPKTVNITLLVATFLTSFLIFNLNFLSEKILIRMNLLKFLTEYNYIVFIVLIGSFFLLIVQMITMMIKKKEDKKIKEFYENQQEELFNDSYAYEILSYMYESHPKHVKLPIQNQKVKLLNQFGLIALASNQTQISSPFEMDNPSFPYILQPIAEKKLKEIKSK